MQRLTRFLELTVDARPLGVARILVALAALVKVLSLSGDLREYSAGNFIRFPYLIDVPAPREDTEALVVVGLWITFGVLFLLGLWTRFAGAGLAVSVLYTVSIDRQMYSNHLYLLIALVALLTVADSGARYSLDSSNGQGSCRVPRWPVTLLKLQITSVYLFAALSKLNGNFLDGDVIRIAFDPNMLDRATGIVSVETLAIAAIATEFFLALGFWFSRVRWMALPVAASFHTLNVVMMGRSQAGDLSIFAVMMAAAILFFFADLWEREPRTSAADQSQPAPTESVA